MNRPERGQVFSLNLSFPPRKGATLGPSVFDTKKEGEEEMEVDALLGGSPSGQSKGVPEPGDQWLHEMDKEDAKEKKGPPVNEQLAKMIDRRFAKPTAIQNVKDLQEKHLTPANCKDMTIPKVSGKYGRSRSTGQPGLEVTGLQTK